MKLIRFIKGVSQFSWYMIGAWLTGMKNFWTDEDIHWFMQETYFVGKNVEKKRDEFREKAIKLADKYIAESKLVITK